MGEASAGRVAQEGAAGRPAALGGPRATGPRRAVPVGGEARLDGHSWRGGTGRWAGGAGSGVGAEREGGRKQRVSDNVNDQETEVRVHSSPRASAPGPRGHTLGPPVAASPRGPD